MAGPCFLRALAAASSRLLLFAEGQGIVCVPFPGQQHQFFFRLEASCIMECASHAAWPHLAEACSLQRTSNNTAEGAARPGSAHACLFACLHGMHVASRAFVSPLGLAWLLGWQVQSVAIIIAAPPRCMPALPGRSNGAMCHAAVAAAQLL